MRGRSIRVGSGVVGLGEVLGEAVAASGGCGRGIVSLGREAVRTGRREGARGAMTIGIAWGGEVGFVGAPRSRSRYISMSAAVLLGVTGATGPGGGIAALALLTSKD